jgi:hypothetical protein
VNSAAPVRFLSRTGNAPDRQGQGTREEIEQPVLSRGFTMLLATTTSTVRPPKATVPSVLTHATAYA